MHVICNQILSQAVVESMKKAYYGRIVNVISTSVKVPINGLGVSNTIRGCSKLGQNDGQRIGTIWRHSQ